MGAAEVFREHSQVELTRPLPTLRLDRGTIGLVVHVHDAGEAYEVEFMAPDGRTAGAKRFMQKVCRLERGREGDAGADHD